ncbi:MAG: ABC-F family ATP-binding cassette domain-containing protein [Clostridia bacterium]|nr:ABC-F family ATP-binding cassette domain-containing protein [Clostridia bacterium]
MIECSIQNISKSFGADKIFENISFEIKTNEKVGLVGPNGVGKSTILKILMGKEDCEGTVAFRKGVVPGYLEQMPEYDDSLTGSMVLELAFEGIREIKNRMHSLEKRMAVLEIHDEIMDEYAALQLEYEMKGGYDTEEKISKVTKGLKIEDKMLATKFNKLSGGEKTKIILGKILLEEPPLLLLDEPSNHLDLSTMEWLEEYIGQYAGAVIIVSHDRYFLDKAVTKIVELSPNKAYVYHGNYSYFVEEKRRIYDLEVKAYNQNQKDIKRVQEQIKRYRIWGAMRDSDKMYAQAKQLERKLEKMDKLDKPVYENKKLRLSAAETKRAGKDAIVGENLSKSFAGNVLFENVDINVYLKDSLAILGDNGCGKSTLLKILINEISPDTGKVKLGANINIGYIAQSISFESEDKAIVDYFQYKYNIDNSVARMELAKVLFTGDDVFKKISVLSGGEKSRLRLCCLMYEKVNLMILDEPTNHLDIESREILEEILSEYTGTIVFVSHDRYFIAKVARRIAVFNGKGIDFYNGDYEYYKMELARKQEIKQEAESKSSDYIKKQQTKSVDTMRENEMQRAAKKLNAMETEIESIEEIISSLGEEMMKYGDDLEKLLTLEEAKARLKTELDIKIEKWERLTRELEQIS